MKHCSLIINPKSGKMQIHKELLNIIDLFNKNNYLVDVHITQYKGHATEIINNMKTKDLLICSGGDGTLNEVISGLIKSEKNIPIGYIPSGSTNDFANSIKIPNKIMAATNKILEGTPFPIDIGCFNNNNYFTYVAGFGSFTSISYNTSQEFKNIFGHLAYIINSVTALSEIKPYKVTYTIDNATRSGEYLLGLVLNTTSVGGILKFNQEDIKLNDGLFEVLLVKVPKTIAEYNQMIEGLMTSNFIFPVFDYMQTDNIKMELEKEISWSLDGEEVKAGKIVEIKNLNNRIQIIT